MSDEGKRDHWGELASLLGAEPPPADQAAQQPLTTSTPAEPEPVQHPQASRTFVTPAAQRSESDWGRLAESLGIAVPLEVPEPAPPAVKQVARTERVEVPPPEKVPSADPVLALETADVELETIEVAEIVPEEGGVPADLFGSVDTGSEVVEAGDRGDRERPERRRRRRRRRGRRPDDSSAAATSETEGVELELPEASGEEESAPVEEAGDLSEIPAAEQAEGPERPRRHRRRRRRKISAREQDAADALDGPPQQAAGAEEETVEVAGFAGGEELAGAREPAVGDQVGPGAGDESPGDLSDLDDDVERASHHGIPTWDEAVGVVVAANMEARARNPGGSSRNRGGRGRGGRS
jgi:ribonuclease E